ncbi:head GIN domain-containing protein [Aureivirga sp. CE67]|uniref:head GIN domain-containing protein n=1 Tax=Aureivirga sp. CE67 TaxID=1788983 RepID=UPI0018C95899|nr:head GIN domain-containing protein [Aureivirga sp. CE67]
MKHILSILVFFVAITTANAQWKKVKGNKNVITATREVSDFQGIKSSGSFDVELTDDNYGTLEITAEENLMEYIITNVDDNILRIGFKKGYNIRANKPLKIKVPVKFLNYVKLSGSGNLVSDVSLKNKQFELGVSGSGDIEMKNIKSEEIFVTMSGSGDMELEGKTNKLSIKISGSADFSGKKLDSNETSIKISGSGNATVVANETLKGKVSGSGDIYYKGNPKTLNVKTSGSGDVEKL